ncbi:hypothetical protein N656DRAFT_763418 [Canariomyces notabilis]|uniref:Mediator of RNA polymerase II transcription subunit 9 n=1 Tax=Canariomyces notabilis TaxID=2074819 RepID=A0AAN6QC25_9PEZI|nr:hypothetical protein N656DRAFT_763418 [Canariomyces arenarius]
MATSHIPEGLSPDAVDTLTELTSIITKLRSAQQQQNLASAAAAAAASSTGGGGTSAAASNHAPAAAAAHQQPSGTTPVAPGAVTGTTPLPSGGVGDSTHGPLLSAKELPAATDNLKHKLQRARAAMRTLADVHRSIAAQEAELASLEGRRRRQADMLARTQEEGLQFVRAEQRSREDEEGDRMMVM